MIGIIGIKIGMFGLYDEFSGNYIPCTIIKAGPCQVIQKKTIESDGYLATQIGFDEKKETKTTKALLGHFKKAGVSPKKKLVELPFSTDLKISDEIKVEKFSIGNRITLVSISKGKGFQGVVKRWGFSGVGGQTRGQHNRLRAPGSIGAGSTPSRVFPGMKMAGRMGAERVSCVTKIVKIDTEADLLIVKGSVAGAKGSYVFCLS